MSERKIIKYCIAVILLMLISVFFGLISLRAQTNTIFLRDGGIGDGTSYENAIGDFKEAVRKLADTGGKIVICGKYTYNELINLSKKSGTSNGDRVITVTSVDGENDYRLTDNAMLCAGDKNGSANMILAGSFVFENLSIVTEGSDKVRAIICGGYDTVFGEGIVCKKQGDAPYISVVGVSFGEITSVSECRLTVKSGTYNNVCAGNRDGSLSGNTTLVIEGGTFDGSVSASGYINEGGLQNGNAYLTVNGGIFHGSVGALTDINEDFILTVNGGTFRKDITALGKYNTVDINGGVLQNVSTIKIADYIVPSPETDRNGNAVQTEEGDIKKSAVNINSYSGNVKKFVEKIEGEGVTVNINTLGGIDIETTDSSDTIKTSPETYKPATDELLETDAPESEKKDQERVYLLGSRNKTVIAVASIGALLALSVIILAYRSVYRKK